MKVKVIQESGYESALLGLGFSYGVTSGLSFEEFMKNEEIFCKVSARATKLAGMGAGHDKFLRSITISIDVTAPRYWWQECDQYKVNTTTLSESTIHTITCYPFSKDLFEPLDNGTPSVPVQIIDFLEKMRLKLLQEKKTNETYNKNLWKQIISCLPQSFLQRRILCCNYQNLASILLQRKGHKLTQWRIFCESILEQVQHPEFFSKVYEREAKGE